MSAQVSGAPIVVERVGRIGSRSSRQHDNSVRGCPPACRLDPLRTQAFKPIGFREDRGGRNDQRGWRSGGERHGEAAPVGDGGDPRRLAGAASKQEHPTIAGAVRDERRSLDQAQPEKNRIAVLVTRDLRGRGRNRRVSKENQDRRVRHGVRESEKATPRSLHLGDDC